MVWRDCILGRIEYYVYVMDAAYSVVTGRVEWSVGRSVGLSVCHSYEPSKNG